jgi:hypothetical protein
MYHRLHDTNYTTVNWMASHKEGIDTILSYRDKKMLPATVARDVLFRSYIHFGEKCMKRRHGRKAVASFFIAWKQKPFSIIPFKKISKAVLYSFKK